MRYYHCVCLCHCVFMLHSHILVHAEIHIYMLDTYRRNEQQTQEDFFNKIFTSHFIARVRKGCVGFYCERLLETEHNWNILTPKLWPSTLCPRFSDAQPEPWGPLCWVLAFFTASYQHLLWTPIHQGFPRAPSAGCGFPYHISSPTPSDLQLNWLVELNWVI